MKKASKSLHSDLKQVINVLEHEKNLCENCELNQKCIYSDSLYQNNPTLYRSEMYKSESLKVSLWAKLETFYLLN